MGTFMEKEGTPHHIIKLIGGFQDGSFMPIYQDKICHVTCVINYDTKTAHYYHLASEEVTEGEIKYQKIWYQFWTSLEFTKENEEYLKEHFSSDYEKMKDFLDKR